VGELLNTGGLFVGGQDECKAFIRKHSDYYVYLLRRPNGQPFYVGKGTGDRVFAHENEARHPNDRRSNVYKLNVIRSIQKSEYAVQYEIDFISSDEDQTYAREAELIRNYKRLHEGGPLTNLAPGGGTSSGAAPASKEKHSATLAGIPDDNPERATLNGFVLSIANMKSVVVKPTNQFTPRPTLRFPNKSRSPTPRQAVALAASAAANCLSIDGPSQIPRKLSIEGVDGLIENGVACDIITSGMASLIKAADPADECFDLTPEQSSKVIELVGQRKCINLGILPDS
jgi:hypothetical protein